MEEYSYVVNDDLSFTVRFHGEEVHRSRCFRLWCQADRQAQEWILAAKGEQPLGDITLDVQNMVIDTDSFF